MKYNRKFGEQVFLMAMDRNMKAFLRVYETGNLTLAAEKLGLAQPSLSKRLKSLENEYCVQLFERHPQGMVPTDFGRTLYQFGTRIEQKHLQAEEALSARKNGHLDVVRVGAGPIVRSYLMRPLTESLLREFPNLRLEFREDLHSRNLPFLKNGDLDIVFGAISQRRDLNEVEMIQMANLTLGILAHKTHPLFSKPSVDASDLAEMPWVYHSDDGFAGKMIEGYYTRHGLEVPQTTVKTTSLEFGIELVEKCGYFMPEAVELSRTYAARGIDALPLKEPIDHFPIGAYVRESSLKFPVVARLIEIASDLASGGVLYQSR